MMTGWLPLLLLASAITFVAADEVVAQKSNETNGDYPFQLHAGGSPTLADLLPVSDAAISRTDALTGQLVVASDGNSANFTSRDIACMSCDSRDYSGFITSSDLLSRVLQQNVAAIIWYTRVADQCEVPDSLQHSGLLYTMVDSMAANNVISSISTGRIGMDTATIQRADSTSTNTASTSSPGVSNPLPPGPSTAVAMIILYCITAVITALFLIIIITGAIRAHRHPERYGRQLDALGQPRQSRARGIARAMLDTLPIVKFGERDTANTVVKPDDVEMGVTSAPGATDKSVSSTTDGVQDGVASSSAVPAAASHNPPAEDIHGISPAQPRPTLPPASEDTTLGCSICTDDFEQGQDIRVLPCSHRFHPACVDPWLLNVSGTCPLCRIDLRHRHDASSSPDATSSTPAPLESSITPDLRRRSALLFLLNPAHRAAPHEEQIAALRRLRAESRASVSRPIAEEQGAEVTDHAEMRRRHRITLRLQETFGIRTRRGGSGSEAVGEAREGPAQDQRENRRASVTPLAPFIRTD